jgi:hypothetical protein
VRARAIALKEEMNKKEMSRASRMHVLLRERLVILPCTPARGDLMVCPLAILILRRNPHLRIHLRKNPLRILLLHRRCSNWRAKKRGCG